jgi:hypothetical protein
MGAVTIPEAGYLPLFGSRDDYVDFLEGYALPTVEQLEQRASRRLVKAYMLETVADGARLPPLTKVFPARVALDRLDEALFRVQDSEHDNRIVGLLEAVDDRHPVFYTTLASDESDKWVRQVVDQSPWLDRLWLSSPILFQLWQYVQETVPPHRYVRLGFEHEAWYESSVEATTPSFQEFDTLDKALADETAATDDAPAEALIERRRSRVQLTERLGVLQSRLPQLTELYDPLRSLVQLQMPSAGRGGHLFHYDGKSTNRSDSFAEHRATLELVLKLYRKLTERAEHQLWVEATDAGDDGYRLTGAPVLIRFSQPLAPPTFDKFVRLGLERKTSRLRIGGYVQRRGPTKVQLAAIDRHLWQPFLLEATSRQLLAVLPRGTCGNTVHRLVTNVQRLVDPDIRVWLGSKPYEEVVASSFQAAA